MLNDQLPTRAAVVTPSATVEQNGAALYIGGDGNVTLIPSGQTGTVVFTGLRAGSILPIRFSKVTAATATGLVRFY
jgi:hypothetical protein